MTELEAALNKELSAVLGASHNWLGVIAGVAGRRASEFARTRNGLFEDVVADVTGDIIVQARTGNLLLAVIRAKTKSETDEQLVDNLRHVVMKAAYFRTSDAMKGRYRSVTQFSQIDDELDFRGEIQAPDDFNEDSDSDLSYYTDELEKELELMAVTAIYQHKNKLAKRYRRAKEMVPDRVGGMPMGKLMLKFDIHSKGTMQLHLDDIGKALARVAERLGDPTLIRGTAGVEV